MARPGWSQNFLVDLNIARKIIRAADLEPQDIVLEIGPGRGALTELIAPAVKKLWAVEIDKYLCQSLQSKLSQHQNIKIFNADFLKFNLKKLSTSKRKPIKIVANLPYSVASPILNKILDGPNWTKAVIMVQKESRNDR